MKSDDLFSEQLEAMRRRMQEVSQQISPPPAQDDLLPEMLEHLGTALEELSVAGEEIRQQTEELTRTQQAIEVERQRYQALFQDAPDGLLVTDADGVIHEANQAAAALLGVQAERLAGKPLLLFIGPDARTAFLECLGRAARVSESPGGLELQLQPRHGPAYPAVATVQSFRTLSGILNLRWALRETTAPPPARETLDREQLLGTLGRMAGRMAHHLASDLATIQGQAELLQAPDFPPRFREHLETLKAACASATELIRRVQTFSRLRPAAPLEPTDVAASLREALAITLPQQQTHAVTVRSEVGELPLVLGHAAEIREALVHLILNAVEAMPPGGTLTIGGGARWPKAAPVAPGIRWVALTLTDTGKGLSEEVRAHLFEPFFTTKGVQRGGLGLAMVYGIMRRHLGAMEVRSAPGGGCGVTLWFQVASPAAARGSESPRPARSLEGVRVLLIDDNDMVRRTFAALLRRSGLVVVEAGSGTEGLAKLTEAPVDLVLTDLQMPGMSGWEVGQAIKSRTPELPVIILTGSAEAPMGGEAGACPADRLVAKPIERDRLLGVIAELVASRREPPGE